MPMQEAGRTSHVFSKGYGSAYPSPLSRLPSSCYGDAKVRHRGPAAPCGPRQRVLPLMTALITDPLFLRHQTGIHPERPQRLAALLERLDRSNLRARCSARPYAPLTRDQVARIHDPSVIARAEAVARAGGGRLDADTVVSSASFDVALAAAGACAAGVDAIVQGQDRTALCLVRPPGHHA